MGVSRAARSALPFLLVPAMLLAPLVAPERARGAAAERFDDERVELPVGLIHAAGGIVVLDGTFSRDGRGQHIALWRPGSDPNNDPETYRADPARSPRYELLDRQLVAWVPLLDQDGQRAGEAVVRADLLAAGDRKPVSIREHSGTTWFREIGWTEPVTVDGSITFPGDLMFSFADVRGSLTVVQTFRSHPDAAKLRQHYSFTLGFVESRDAFGSLALFLGDGVASRIELLLIPTDPSLRPLFANTEITATDPLGASLEVALESPDGPIEQPAHVDVALARTGHREVFKTRSENSLRTMVEEVLSVRGSMSFPGGFTFDLSAAESTLVDVHFAVSTPDGGRPAGATPVNDTAGGALPLRRGDTSSGFWTGGASPLPEHSFSEAFGYTVWYRIEGDGSPVTVDTAGSDFDTVISLHQDAGSGLEWLGEFDDQIVGRTDAVLEFQARTTWETVPGVAYYVQVGGFHGGNPAIKAETGRLTLAVTGG